MDFDDTPDEAAWRTRVRAFLEQSRPDPDDPRGWQAALYEAGFVGVAWPVEAGGRGGTLMQQAIVDQEMARLGLPALINLIGIGMCGPTVIMHGSADQKSRYLQRLLRADDLWCQLFSEPEAGSDLAALRTRAVREPGGGWRITGQKVWTTLAHLADYGILLTRTDPGVPKHRGLTMFVVDMSAPGVTVRPLRQMNGDAHFNEVFFDDVAIPDSERLGEPGDGWRVALTTLMSERLSLGGGGTGIGPKPEAVARHVAAHLGALSADRQALARQQLGRGYVAALGARYTGYRQLSRISRGELPGPEASAGKLSGTRSARDLTDLAVRVLGEDARVAGDIWQNAQAVLPGMAIAGGSDQVLRNIIGERVLGLPAEPRADKGVTFRESIG
ncbi:acyl-CoA dehydrogenase family protein [Actinoplanes utahensis]|uniref:Acyl-CoA dehydrogenase n=1 Tax=Actinoplanes utahensis TaxID=1869 RepID=A0A0A6UHJ9_ACTUT|nr:acyl-CoA dehydrogenase family protein [Actinoplanes utahensis]KHD75530.1 acyl-CoA dehydrogenase [Actinoplanes utahensis]GIF32325.1 acyl-CoA dehydrogenase [Actinoplanes utahensis]